ncbi:MAG: HAMP domain-containing protein [Helicobacteraceae bacterium]|nr:HAMP domain-containing protein [Helicobacteraceae bacterium]
MKLNLTGEGREGALSLSALWFCATICPSVFTISDKLISEFAPWQAVLFLLIGFGVASAAAFLIGSQSCDLRKRGSETISAAMGAIGARFLFTVPISIVCIGWFGIQTAQFGALISSIVSSAYGVWFDPKVCAIAFGTLSTLTLFFGFKAIKIFCLFAAPISLSIMLFALYHLLTAAEPVSTQAGMERLAFSHGTAAILGAAALVVAICGDYYCYAKSRKTVFVSIMLGLMFTATAACAVTFLSFSLSGNGRVALVLSAGGFPLAGILLTFISSFAVNLIYGYSGSLAIFTMLEADKKRLNFVIAAFCLVGTIMGALGITVLFDSLLSFANSLLPPIIGVMIASYWVEAKGRAAEWREASADINIIGVSACLIGLAADMLSDLLGGELIAEMNALIASIVAYIALSKLMPPKWAKADLTIFAKAMVGFASIAAIAVAIGDAGFEGVRLLTSALEEVARKGTLEINTYIEEGENLAIKLSFLIAAAVVTMLTIAVMFSSLFTSQLAKIANSMRAIAKGDYTKRLTYRSKDELGMVIAMLNMMTKELQRQFYRIARLNEFSSRFVPTKIIQRLEVDDITKLRLGDNVVRDFTIMFFDIRSFSAISERLSAKETFELLNKVFTLAGPIVQKYGGFIDKHMGDSAMTVFDDAYCAVRTGVELCQKLTMYPETRVSINGAAIRIGVGLHSGSGILGIIGDEKRFAGTVVSKHVNLASRLESLTKQAGSSVIFSKDTLERMGEESCFFEFRTMGKVRVAGISEEIEVFDMLDALPDEVRQRRLASREAFERAVALFSDRRYEEAYQMFQEIVLKDETDEYAMFCLGSTEKHIQYPSLDPVFSFSIK